MIKQKLLLVMCAAFIAESAFAAVSAEEAKQLGATLTAFGAEKAGNKEGTIPEYVGQPLKTPPGYDPLKGEAPPDPWNEKPLFSITAQNYEKYADKLDQMVELFKKYPNYRMDVYPSHRTWVYPQAILDNSIKNATSCKAVSDELKLEGCYAGVPFPIPKTGAEAMWNHLTGYESSTIEAKNDNYIIPLKGNPVLNATTVTTQHFPFFNLKGVVPSNTVFFAARVENLGPARTIGNKLVVIDSLDLKGIGRRAWQYIPGQRRVKLAPDLAYDTPSPFSGGSATMDDQKAFLGSFDRYNLTLKGKKEKYIPYNAFKILSKRECPTEVYTSTKGFPNPDCMRWELHRVRVIEATLKPEFRHVYKRRVFYFDEDAPGVGVAENYDASGKLYRLTQTVNYPWLGAPGGVAGSMFFNLDLQTGMWAVASGATCKECTPYILLPDYPQSYFSPEALAGEGIR